MPSENIGGKGPSQPSFSVPMLNTALSSMSLSHQSDLDESVKNSRPTRSCKLIRPLEISNPEDLETERLNLLAQTIEQVEAVMAGSGKTITPDDGLVDVHRNQSGTEFVVQVTCPFCEEEKSAIEKSKKRTLMVKNKKVYISMFKLHLKDDHPEIPFEFLSQ